MTISQIHTNRGLRVLAPLLATLAVVALIAGACGSDNNSAGSSKKDKDSTTSTTAKGSDNKSDSTESTAPKGEDFTSGIQTAMKQLESASSPCDVYEVFNTVQNVNPPKTKEETKLASEYYEKLLMTAANTASDPATAKTLKEGATKFAEYAKSVDYDPKKMDFEGSGPQFDGADAMQSAMQTYSSKDLMPCAPTPPSAPDGSQVPTTAP